MVIRLGNILFDHVAGRGLRCAVHSALCLGPDDLYGWRWLELTLLAPRVISLRCQSSDAIGREADMPRPPAPYRSDATDPGCVKTHTVAKCRKDNSPGRHH